MTSVYHHGIQVNGTRCGRTFHEGSCGGSDRWWGKATVFLNFVGFIVICSPVGYHWCLLWLYGKCFSPSSMENFPSGEGRRVCIQAFACTYLITNCIHFSPPTMFWWSWQIAVMVQYWPTPKEAPPSSMDWKSALGVETWSCSFSTSHQLWQLVHT